MTNALENKQLTFNNGSNVFFTSDTHFFHKNILDFSKRPFGSIEKMNETFISNWNSVVGEDDVVFHLGDFAWGQSWVPILEQLNGSIHLILGNHDVGNWRPGYAKFFTSIQYQQQIVVEGRTIYLNHFPFLVYGGMHRENQRTVWQLHGHVHSGPGLYGGLDLPKMQYASIYQYDVGVDNNNFTPVSFTQINKIIEDRKNEEIHQG